MTRPYAEKTVKQQQHLLNEYQNNSRMKPSGLSTVLDAAKKKMCAENSDFAADGGSREPNESIIRKIWLVCQTLEDQGDLTRRARNALLAEGKYRNLNTISMVSREH